MNRFVIYTAIFGSYDKLWEPKVRPEGVDFVCFTDQPLTSKVWQIRQVEPIEGDPTRSARKYKILPHRYLGGYDISIWVDGNVHIVGDTTELVVEYLKDSHMAVYNHAYSLHRDKRESPNALHSVREQLDHLLALAERERVKDDSGLMKRQVEHYIAEGFPDDAGILQSSVLLRRHNEQDVVETMEAWWQEIKKWSKRDQLSFNYAAWKTGLNFSYINENVRNNSYFKMMSHGK